jgi:beta-glucosidase
VADVLYGLVNPSGKLAHTIAKKETDYPVGVCETDECDFSEGVYIDYRWFDANNITTRFPFGYGMTYTSFAYSSHVAVNITNSTALSLRYPTGSLGLGGQSDLWDEVVTVSSSVSNTGSLDGAEVAQLYVGFPGEAEQPMRILRGFDKVRLAPGESAQVNFSLRRRDLSYWDTVAQRWAIASGEYTFSVGASSADIKGTQTMTI